MRKFSAMALCLIMILALAASCGTEDVRTADRIGDKLSIVATIFPEYDWVREILGDRADSVRLTLLLDSGVDLHSYQPTADDIVTISTCDLFIYVGGESDEWVDDALKEATNGDMAVIDLLEALGDAAKEEELVEGMEGEEEEETYDEEGPEYDEHVWLSLRNAQTLCNAICDKLSAIDPTHADLYAANTAAYVEKLSALDGQYQAAVSAAEKDTLLFGDRFPFRYLADDYDLNYYAAFGGCSAESEASFETIAFLAGKADELGLGTVLTIEGTNHNIAQTVAAAAESDVQILSMDSLQSATSRDVAAGATYLAVMENNLAVLKEALK